MFQQKLKELRSLSNLSQKELATKLSMSPNIICEYEKGRSQPNIDTLIKLSTIFNCSVDYLINSDVSPISNTTLTREQAELLSVFNLLTLEDQREVIGFAKALAYATGLPLVPVSHIRGHIAASYLADKELQPPFISILASGGHTAIAVVHDYYNIEVLGSTKDDAVGEAFDKVARVLGLNYPGGPNVERLAKEGKNTVKLPSMLKNYQGSEYDFSYSGLKTAVINSGL